MCTAVSKEMRQHISRSSTQHSTDTGHTVNFEGVRITITVIQSKTHTEALEIRKRSFRCVAGYIKQTDVPQIISVEDIREGCKIINSKNPRSKIRNQQEHELVKETYMCVCVRAGACTLTLHSN